MKTSKRLMVALVTTALVCLCASVPRWALAQEEDVDVDGMLALEDVASEDGDADNGLGVLVAPSGEGGEQDGLGSDDTVSGKDGSDQVVSDQHLSAQEDSAQELSAQEDSESGVIELEPSSNANDDARNLQNALNEAQNYTGEGQFKVVLKPGIYELGYGLTIYSNTELVLEDGAIIKRAEESNGNSLFNIGFEASAESEYETASNVTITGGVWDNANHQKGKVLHFEQCHDIVIQDATFQHSRADHVILFDGVKDAQVVRCTLVDCISAASENAKRRYVNEAIHIDSTLGVGNDTTGHKDGLPSSGITVDGCIFDGVCCAVGAHYHGADDPVQHDVTVSNNVIEKIESDSTAFTAANTTGWTVENNTFNGTGKEYFVRFNGCKDYNVANNTVSNVLTFALDNGAETGLASNGTLTGNKATGITGSAFRSYGIASAHTLNGESYKTVRTDPMTTDGADKFIYAKNATMVVKGCTFSSSESGYKASSAYVTTIAFDGGKLTFKNNKVYNTPYAGLCLANLTSATVTGNTLGYCARVTSNTGTNSYTLILNKCTGCTVTGNTLKSCKRGGIYLNNSTKNNVSSNKITAAKDKGVFLLESSNNTIQSNEVTASSSSGVHMSGSNGNTIKSNTITAAKDKGVVLTSSSSNTLQSNTIKATSSIGVYLSSSNKNKVTSNSITALKDRGIYLLRSSSNTIQSNTITVASTNGIHLSSSNKNTVKSNTIIGAIGKQDVSQSSSSGNTISNNGPVFSGATRMPVQSTATYSITGGKLSSSNTGVVSVSGKKLTAKKTGTVTITLTYNGRTYTKKVTVYTIHGKTYEMQSSVDSNYVLDIQKASPYSGAQMIVYKRKTTGNADNQKYQFYLQNDNTYCIRSLKSKKWLNVNPENKKYVVQWNWTGGDSTKWRITVDSSNRVTFVNKAYNQCFDVQGGKTKNGAKMIIWKSTGRLNQKWVLK